MLTLHPKYIYISIYQYFIILSENIEILKNLQMLAGSHSLIPADDERVLMDFSLGLQD